MRQPFNEGEDMTKDAQQAQQDLIEQALGDPRVADAVRAYDAVRPYVPEQTRVPVATTYSASTSLTLSLPHAQ